MHSQGARWYTRAVIPFLPVTPGFTDRKQKALGRSGRLRFHARKRQPGKNFSSKGRRKKCTFYPHTAVHKKHTNKPEPKHQSRAGAMHEPPCNKLEPKHLAPIPHRQRLYLSPPECVRGCACAQCVFIRSGGGGSRQGEKEGISIQSSRCGASRRQSLLLQAPPGCTRAAKVHSWTAAGN